MASEIQIILWAQWRALRRWRRWGGRASGLLAAVACLWYAGWAALAMLVAAVAAKPGGDVLLRVHLASALMFAAAYWQLAPILTGSYGGSLEIGKLVAFPVRVERLFWIEVALRLTNAGEVLLLMAGLAVGMARNPAVKFKTAPAALALFCLFNLLAAAGLRQQVQRWMQRRRLREVIAGLLVAAAALPQLLMVAGVPAPLRRLGQTAGGAWWPWSVTARLALGDSSLGAWTALGGWVLAARFYARRQFARSLRLDADATAQRGTKNPSPGRLDAIYRLPSRVLPDPLGAMVEKELRSLARSPRFRLLFIMGFTFGVVIFLPMVLSGKTKGGFPGAHGLVLLCAYSLLLLGDAVFWNIFGLDRAAARAYFLYPAPFSRVLAGKNLAAGVFLLLEITAIIAVWALLRLPVNGGIVLEAFLVTATMCLYLLAAGNISSVGYPRPVNPERSMGSAAPGRLRGLLLLLYPLLAAPVLLAYGAWYAFGSRTAFYSVLGLVGGVGAVLYRLSLESAAAWAERDRERFVAALSDGGGPLSLS